METTIFDPIALENQAAKMLYEVLKQHHRATQTYLSRLDPDAQWQEHNIATNRSNELQRKMQHVASRWPDVKN